MNDSRRKTLKLLAALAAAGVAPAAWADWNQAAFEMKGVPEAMRALGAQSPPGSDAILIKAPDIAENGAVVPIEIQSSIPGTRSIAVLIEKNPFPYAASFDFAQGAALPFVALRVKMGETSNVRVVVATADGKFHAAAKEVKVTIGGCGG